MEYQVRENVSSIKVELRCGMMTVHRNAGNVMRVVTPDSGDNSVRIFTHSNTIFVKYISPTLSDIQLYIPKTVRDIHAMSDNCSFIFENIDFDALKVESGKDIIMKRAVVRKNCQFNVENADIKLIDCDISSMNVQLLGGALEFVDTILHGNSIAYIMNGYVGGFLKGALVDYVISAGSGINPDNVIVNDHLLSEFPNRKNVQNCAWLLLAGSLNGISKIKISKPRSGIY